MKELIDLDNFQKYLSNSNDSTSKMTNLLTSFETRLSGLSDLIMPVYLSTNGLKVKLTSNSISSLIFFKQNFI